MIVKYKLSEVAKDLGMGKDVYKRQLLKRAPALSGP